MPCARQEAKGGGKPSKSGRKAAEVALKSGQRLLHPVHRGSEPDIFGGKCGCYVGHLYLSARSQLSLLTQDVTDLRIHHLNELAARYV